jgi:hypothetical protein
MEKLCYLKEISWDYRLSTSRLQVACYDHKFAGARTGNLMGLISPAALQQVRGGRNIAAVYYRVGRPIICNQTISQSVVKITNRFQRRVFAALEGRHGSLLELSQVRDRPLPAIHGTVSKVAGAIGLTGYDPSAASCRQSNLTVVYPCHFRVRA